ncbi:MAG: D-ribose pyranase [Brevinemataceae bacterium]
MKKTAMINSNISTIIAHLGHTDTIAIGDMGLPIPDHVEKIDLSIKMGVPTLKEVLDAILTEMYVEEYTFAEEANSDFRILCKESFGIAQKELPLQKTVSHKEFKELLNDVKAVIRTGEALPYYNIILRSGVTF